MFGCSLISEMQSLFVCQHSPLRECVFPQSIKSSHVNHYLASSLRPQLIWSDWLPDASQSNQIALRGNPLPVGPATVRWYRAWDLVLKISEQSKPVQRESGAGREREAKQSTIWFQRESGWLPEDLPGLMRLCSIALIVIHEIQSFTFQISFDKLLYVRNFARYKRYFVE